MITSSEELTDRKRQTWNGQFLCSVAFLVSLVAKLCLTLFATPKEPTRLLCPWDFPGKNAGVGRHFLLQGVFLTQGSNLCLLHCRLKNGVISPFQHGTGSFQLYKWMQRKWHRNGDVEAEIFFIYSFSS